MENNVFGPEKLYIIGSGFDMHHNVKCDYDSFKKWLQTNCINVYDNIKHIYGNVCNDKWWSSFEESLAVFDPDKYPNEVAQKGFFQLKKELSERYGARGKAAIDDFEMEGGDISNRYHLAAAIAKSELECLKTDLDEAFGEWIKSLKLPSKKTPDIDIDTDAIFFTFNYTRTLEDLYEVDEDNILHLHGSVDGNEFVIGHNLTAEEMIDKDLEAHMYERNPDNDKGEDEARFEMFQVIEDEMKKPVNEIMDLNRDYFNALDTIKEMIVLGFSYSPIDLPYLRRIFEITGKNIDVIFSWHTDIDYSRAESFSNELSLSNCTFFYF